MGAGAEGQPCKAQTVGGYTEVGYGLHLLSCSQHLKIGNRALKKKKKCIEHSEKHYPMKLLCVGHMSACARFQLF